MTGKRWLCLAEGVHCRKRQHKQQRRKRDECGMESRRLGGVFRR